MNQSNYTSETYQPIYIPMTDEAGEPKRNIRRCRCARCRRELPPGQGYKWDYTQLGQEFVLNAHSGYYCQICHTEKTADLRMAPRIEGAMDTIREWCTRWVILSMGWHAAFHIDKIIRNCGHASADVAEAIRDALPSLEGIDTSYGAVVSLAQEIASKVYRMGGSYDC